LDLLVVLGPLDHGDYRKDGPVSNVVRGRTIGAQAEQVDEPFSGPEPVVCFEFEAYPEAKALGSCELRALYARYQSYYRVAELVGASEAFVRQNAKASKLGRSQ